jgi:predicted ATP-grasp superfamily ATP-dependent carboligase
MLNLTPSQPTFLGRGWGVPVADRTDAQPQSHPAHRTRSLYRRRLHDMLSRHRHSTGNPRRMKTARSPHAVEAVLTAYDSANNLGVLRNLARMGVPVTLLVPHPRTMPGWSRYPTRRLACPDVNRSPADFLRFLLTSGEARGHKAFLIPSGDAEALLMSTHRDALREHYVLTVPSLEVMETLVNKGRFYRFLDAMSVPHPATHYPDSPSALRSVTAKMAYPYLVKPIYSHLFQQAFKAKNRPIFQAGDLDDVAAGLAGANLEVMVQEIVPGDDIYMCALTMDANADPIAICGYDKVRQYVPDFGDGSLCRSRWRAGPVETAIEILRASGYRGVAEAEFKKDPRDGLYKLLEINARTTTQSGLAAACGTNMEYLAYLDAIGAATDEPPPPAEGLVWIHEFRDLRSWGPEWAAGRLGLGDVLRSMRGRRVYAIAAWDDPAPLAIAALRQVSVFVKGIARRLFRKRARARPAADFH